MSAGSILLRGLRIGSIGAPLGGAAATLAQILVQNDQRILCAQVPGADLIGDGVGLLNIAIACTPWLVIAACQVVGWWQKLRLSEVWRLLVIAFSAWYVLSVVQYLPTPIANAEHCSLVFWRHEMDDTVMLGGLAFPIAIVSLLIAALVYFNIRMVRKRARAREDVL